VTILNDYSSFEQLDLSHLRHFFAVASFEGFSRASRATGVSQPALSLGLKKLEGKVGVTLVDRSSGPFLLTQAGLQLFTFCQELELKLKETLSGLGSGNFSLRRRLRVGTALSIGCGPLAGLFEWASNEAQLVELEVSAMSTFQLLSDLNAGTIAAAIVPDDVQDSRLVFTPLLKDEVCFAFAPKLQDRFRKGRWREGVKQVPLLTYPRETPMRYLVDRLCLKENLEFKVSLAINGAEALKSLLLQGIGAAFVLRSLVRQELEAGLLKEPENLPFALPRRSIMIAARPDAMGASTTELIRNNLKTHSKER
jgi:LysR family transcriptional regulator, transcriptional activator of the cysJI operon